MDWTRTILLKQLSNIQYNPKYCSLTQFLIKFTIEMKEGFKPMPSFDIVSKIDITAVDNALSGVTKEMQVRYDFKGSLCEVSRTEEAIHIKADDELKRRQVEELIITHLTRKGVDTKALEFENPEQAGGNAVRQTILVRQGVHREVAQKIVKSIKGAKLKTQASIQGDEIRVSGKKRDDLQATMSMIKALELDMPLQYENFRD